MSREKSSSREWMEILDSRKWDELLSKLNGHPLQSALWGDARCEVDGIHDMRFVCIEAAEPVFMARVEERRIPLAGKVAWIPRGPTIADGINYTELEKEFDVMLKHKGFCLAIHDLYEITEEPLNLDNPAQIKTIFIDLSVGISEVEKRLSSQWRSRVKKAKELKVCIEQSRNEADVSIFFNLCDELSQMKGFELPGSEKLFQELVSKSESPRLEMELFLAKVDGVIGAGLLIARSGKHIHYMWGASDRSYAKHRVSEVVQWGVIEWAIAKGCTLYDLEGIDPVNNPGSYQFKKKMGGNEVVLRGKCNHPLDWRGVVIQLAGRLAGRL